MSPAVVYFCHSEHTQQPWILPPIDNQWLRQPMSALWRARQGRIRFHTASGDQTLEAGSALLMRRDLIKSIDVRSGQAEYQHLLFYARPDPGLPVELAVPDGEAFDCCFARLQAAYHQHGGRAQRTTVWLSALVEVLVSDHAPAADGTSDRIRSCCTDIDADPGADWSVAHLARHCGYSADHFTRLFKEAMLVSPRTYITRARLHAARCRLRDTDDSVAAIARDLGYSNPAHFSTHFQRHMGMSPSACRRREQT